MTTEKWKELTPKQQWDIQVALRGPDSKLSEGIKWFTTSVIRYEMHNVMRVGGLVNTHNIKFILVPKGHPSFEEKIKEEVPRILLWDYSHFREHVVTAASHLDLPIIYVGFDEWVKVFGDGNAAYYNIMNDLFKLAKDHPDIFIWEDEGKKAFVKYYNAVKESHSYGGKYKSISWEAV